MNQNETPETAGIRGQQAPAGNDYGAPPRGIQEDQGRQLRRSQNESSDTQGTGALSQENSAGYGQKEPPQNPETAGTRSQQAPAGNDYGTPPRGVQEDREKQFRGSQNESSDTQGTGAVGQENSASYGQKAPPQAVEDLQRQQKGRDSHFVPWNGTQDVQSGHKPKTEENPVDSGREHNGVVADDAKRLLPNQTSAPAVGGKSSAGKVVANTASIIPMPGNQAHSRFSQDPHHHNTMQMFHKIAGHGLTPAHVESFVHIGTFALSMLAKNSGMTAGHELEEKEETP